MRTFRDDEYSPLSFIDSVEICRVLLDSGADPNHARPGRASDILFWAASAGRLEIIKMLIAAGARVESELPAFSGERMERKSSVHAAANDGQVEIVRCLLEAGGRSVLNCF